MRRYNLFFAFLLICATMSAQINRTVKYDFTNPPSLNPSLPELEPHSYDVIALDDYKFIAGPAVLSFHNPDRSAAKLEDVGSGKNCLVLYRGQYMDIESKVDVINEVRFYGRQIGDLGVALNTPGEFDFTPYYSVWMDKENQNSHLVQLQNTGQTSMLDSIVVYYTVTQNVFMPILQSIEDNEVINSFKSISLTFSENIRISDAADITLKNSKGDIQKLSATANGITAIISSDTVVTSPDTYTLVVTEGSISTSDGVLYNNSIIIPFTIELPKNSFAIKAVTPAAGKVTEVPTTIELEFPGTVAGINDQVQAKLLPKDDHTALCLYTPSITGLNKVTLTSNIKFPIEQSGIYSLVIPEGMVFDVNYKEDDSHGVDTNGAKYNPADTVMYYIDVDVPVDPVNPDPSEPEKPVASPEKIESATSLLTITGVGYPSATSRAREQLKALLEDIKSTDDQYSDAIYKFYTSTDIEMPEDGNTYRIINIAKDGTKRYLTYANGSVSLSTKLEDAYRFEARNVEDGKVLFITEDNKYLHTLVNTDTYSVTQKKNVLSVANDYTSLSIRKFTYSDVPYFDSFGLVTLRGKVGEKNGANAYYYSLVNTKVGEIDMLDPDMQYFDDQYSTVFKIQQSDRPYKPFSTAVSLSPSSGTVTNLEDIVITFPELSGVTYYKDKPIVLKDGNGNVITPNSITPTGNNSNSYTIKFVNVARGYYTLTAPKGAFMCGNDTIQEITANYAVAGGYELQTDFITTWYYSIGNNPTTRYKYYTRELNDVIFFDYSWTDSNVFVNPNAEVKLYSAWANVVVGKGKLEKVKVPVGDGYCTGVHIVWDQKYKEGDLMTMMGEEEGYTYKIAIPEGAFGDVNFSHYLKDPSSVRKTDCHINQEHLFLIQLFPDVPFETTYTLAPLPGEVSVLDSVVFSFPRVRDVEYNNDYPVTLTSQTGETIKATSTVISGRNYNVCTVYFSNVDKGTYTLTAPKGAFVTGQDTIQTLMAEYVVEVGCSFNTHFAANLSALVNDVPTSSIKVVTENLNDVMFYDESWVGTTVAVNESAKVVLLDSEKKEVGTGKLQLSSAIINVAGSAVACPTIKVLWDKAFVEGDLTTKQGTLYGCDFEFVIPEAAFGDENYSKYLVSSSSVNKSECQVNSECHYTMRVYPDAPFEAKYELTAAPGDVPVLEEIIIKFPELTDVRYNKLAPIHLMSSEPQIIVSTNVSSISQDRNEFSIKFMNIEKGEYTLNIPEGAFICGRDTVPAIKAHYNVTDGVQYTTDFASNVVMVVNKQSKPVEKYYTEDINHVVFYDTSWQESEIYLDVTKQASLLDAEGKVFATGTISIDEVRVSNANGLEIYPAISIKWTKQVEKGDIPTSKDGVDGYKYRISIPEGTVGDANFAKFLDDSSSVKKSSCRTNAAFEREMTIYPDPITLGDIELCIDDYLSGESQISIVDLTDMINKYLNQ
ncbi:MAG: hypothetical protein MJZ36_01695 [Bacteroidaceae bacterium]|nr:hypothetical protein [Bacteroidaceae bacterium]